MSYLKSKKGSLESSILGIWNEAAKKQQEKLDPVNKADLRKDFQGRSDKDIDNDGDVDSTDKYLHKRRKAITKNIKKEKKCLHILVILLQVKLVLLEMHLWQRGCKIYIMI